MGNNGISSLAESVGISFELIIRVHVTYFTLPRFDVCRSLVRS